MNRKLVLKMLGYVLALEAGLLMLPLMVGADVLIRPLKPGTHPEKEERHGADVRRNERHTSPI